MFINAEGGAKVSALRKHGVDPERLLVWPAPSDPPITAPNLARRLEGLHEQLLSGFHDDPDFLFLISIDSFTEVFSVLRDQAQETRVGRASKRLQGKAELADLEVDFVDRDDYGIATNQARKLLRRFRDLPCHVVLTALEKYEEKTDETVPAVSPAIRVDLLGMVDTILYSKVAPLVDDGEEFHRALTAEGGGGSTRGKDRYDFLPRVLVEPTFERILQYKLGELTEETDPLQVAYNATREELAAEQAAKEAAREEAKAARVKKAPARRSRAAGAAKVAEEGETNAEGGKE